MTYRFSLIAIVLLFCSTALLAADKNSASVTFNEPVEVSGAQIQPGDYKLVWEGSGPDVQVSFEQSRKTIATVPAKLVEEPTQYDEAIETVKGPGDSTVVKAIDWKSRSLVFSEEAPSQ